jgi:hypothetical protein
MTEPEKHLKVGFFEDEESLRRMWVLFTNESGNEVVAQAGSVEEATEVIEPLQAGDMDFAFVDGNFSPNEKNNEEGAKIAKMLREKLEDSVIIIGVSGTDTEISGVDVTIPKPTGKGVAEFLDKHKHNKENI